MLVLCNFFQIAVKTGDALDASTPLAPRPPVLKKEPSTSSVRMPAVRKFTFKVSMTARDGACCALYARTFPFRHAALLLVPTSARRPFQASAFALSSVMRTIRRGIVPLRCARCRAWQGQCVGVQAKYLVCPVKGVSPSLACCKRGDLPCLRGGKRRRCRA